MSDAATTPPAEATPATPGPAGARPRRRLLRFLLIGLGAVVLLLVGVGVLGRYGVLTGPARAFIEARTDGLKVSRYGFLKVEGLEGDIWRDFRVRRLTIRDGKGVWLEAQGLRMRWRSGELIARRFHATDVAARQITVFRAPVLGPPGPKKPSPITAVIDRLSARVVTRPELTQRPGDFDVLLTGLLADRAGGAKGGLNLASRLRPGDGARLSFETGNGKLNLDAEAVEAQGGALAGAAGLPADQPFLLDAEVRGQGKTGRLKAVLRTGGRTPLLADGAWGEGGGQAQGRADLTASRLTRPFAARVGNSVGFAVRGARRAGDIYDLGVALRTDNLRLDAKGPLNIKTKGSAGLQAALATPDLQRLTGAPASAARLGGATLGGTLSGELDDLVFDGRVAAQRVGVPDFQLAQVAGPVRVERVAARGRQTLKLRTELKGAGGVGKGVALALLGAAPSLTLDAEQLPDGRTLVNRVRARGDGLTLDAQGSRGLLGGLDFKGELTAANLQRAAPGARGRLLAGWSAKQGAPRGDRQSPWAFTLDARGDGLAVGQPEADRLLGAAPRLRLDAALDGRAVQVRNLQLDGAKAQVTGQGDLGGDGALKVNLDWRADGPFRAGPVEITGQARGDGALTGTLERPKAELTAAFDRIDVPELPLADARLTLTFQRTEGGGDGAVSLTGGTAYGPARARSDFRFVPGGVDLTGIDADAGGVQAQGAFSLRRGAPSAADLRLAAGPGAFLREGRVTATARLLDSAGGMTAAVEAAGSGVTPRQGTLQLSSVSFSASGPLTRLPFRVQASGEQGPTPFRVAGDGVFSQTGEGAAAVRALSFAGTGSVRGVEVRTTEAAQLRLAGADRSARLRLAVGGGAAAVDARQTGDAVNVTAQVTGADLKAFSRDLAGQITADLRLAGRGQALSGEATARLVNARSLDAPANLALTADVRARLSDQRLTLTGAASSAQGLQAGVDASLPVETSAQPFRVAVARTRPISGRFNASGELKPLWDLFLGGERSLSGRLQASGTVGGTLNKPSVNGSATLADGAFEDSGTGLALRRVALAAGFGADRVQVTTFTAEDGRRGRLSGEGAIGLAKGASSDFRLRLTDFQLIDNDLLEAQASGEAVIVRGGDGNARLTGALTIDRAEVNAAQTGGAPGVVTIAVTERNKPGAQTLGMQQAQGGRPAGPAVALDVTLKAPRGVFVRGRGLDAELSLDAKVTGTTSAPNLVGEARVVRGEFSFSGKRFEFDDQSRIQLATQPDRIRLYLAATRDDPSLAATVNIRGTAARPEITLSSTPSLPNDEVLSQVLFGRSASQLSPLEAAQLGASLAALAGGGGLDVIGNLRAFAGLDRLAFGGGDSGMSVSGGKYLTDDIYLELTGGGRDGPNASVEWRVRRNLSVVSRFGGEGDARLSVRWRRDFR